MPERETAQGHPALTDPETGLANDLHFELVYGYLVGAGDRGVALTAMLVQAAGIDADEPDHELLTDVSTRIQAVSRAADLVAHLGGGRFVFLLLGSNLQGGMIVADRVQTTLDEILAEPISAGLAAYAPEMAEDSDLLKAAEDALERARASGGGVEVTHT